MANIEDLKAEEMEVLRPNDEVQDLEQIIMEGTNAKIPIEITYGKQKFGAMIRPLTNIEWQKANQKALKNPNTTNEVELLRLGLYNKDGNPFPADIIPKLPAGISSEIMKQIAEISGVKINSKENLQMVKDMMGF